MTARADRDRPVLRSQRGRGTQQYGPGGRLIEVWQSTSANEVAAASAVVDESPAGVWDAAWGAATEHALHKLTKPGPERLLAAVTLHTTTRHNPYRPGQEATE